MPKKNGIECLKEIRSDKQYADLPVIMLTTSARPLDKSTCMTIGANHYFTKPLSYEGLKNIIQKLCAGKFTNLSEE